MTDTGNRAEFNESLAGQNAADDDLDEVERERPPDDTTAHDEGVMTADEKIDEAGRESFPASDPPAMP